MKLSDFYFDLPESLIAQYPLDERCASRLLVYDRQTSRCSHRKFKAIASCFEAGDLLVMNNSKVLPARFYGRKPSGGKVEFLFERMLTDDIFLAHIKTGKSLAAGSTVILQDNRQVEITGREGYLFTCRLDGNIEEFLLQAGSLPLPPYITRLPEALDTERYQTVYARHNGSVAAPTAGLHFDTGILAELEQAGIHTGYLTLHVGSGTFKPVRTENIHDHVMHTEHYHIDERLCAQITATKAAGKRVIAVGTTTLRTLESSYGKLTAGYGKTNIFITPGFEFKICDGLLTNFHLPGSTLLMLVAAFIGHSEAMALYETAIAHQYRFFSYGDASLLL